MQLATSLAMLVGVPSVAVAALYDTWACGSAACSACKGVKTVPSVGPYVFPRSTVTLLAKGPSTATRFRAAGLRGSNCCQHQWSEKWAGGLAVSQGEVRL